MLERREKQKANGGIQKLSKAQLAVCFIPCIPEIVFSIFFSWVVLVKNEFEIVIPLVEEDLFENLLYNT